MSAFAAGQQYRSLRLADYRVTLLRRAEHSAYDDEWFVTPEGASAFGKYTERESVLRDHYERVPS